MNAIFLTLVLSACLLAAGRQLTWLPDAAEALSPMALLTQAMVKSAQDAVTLALGLVGVMALFLGLMKVAERGGLLRILARLIRPLTERLFPELPRDHPAMGAIILNLSANFMGLGNAATPFGIQAMREMERLNPHPGVATNAMAMFLALNTSCVTLVPTSVLALRATLGSHDPAAILPTTLFASFLAMAAAIPVVLWLQRFFPLPATPPQATETPAALPDDHLAGYAPWVAWLALGGALALIPLTAVYGQTISPWVIPGLMGGILLFGAVRGVAVYEAFVEGGKEGFEIALKIIPFLVAILVAVGMFRASGGLELVVGLLAPLTTPLGMPAEALPMALLRPLSGSGAFGVMADIMREHGPDSYVGLLASTIQGSTETTFYVLAVYFGAVRISRVRHTLAAALIADLVSIGGAVFICARLF